jgi:hypothetical protein
MTSCLTILMIRGKLIWLIKRLKLLSLCLIKFNILVFLINFTVPLGLSTEKIILIEVLVLHEFVGVRLGVEITPMHLFRLSDYGYSYNTYRVFGVIGEYYWVTPLFVMMWDCFLRNEAGEAAEANSSNFFMQ